MNVFLNFLKGDISSPFAPSKQGIFDGLVGSGLSAIGGIVTNAMNANQNEKNRQFQKEENAYNRVWQSNENRKAEQFQEKMWNLQNEYNTPSAQRQRLQEAGYNPWMSGSGSPSTVAESAGQGHSGAAPQISAPSALAMSNPFSAGLGQFLEGQRVNADIANQGAKTLSELISVYREALKNGMSPDDARDLVAPFMSALQGLGTSTNRYLDQIDLDNERMRLDNAFHREINPLLVNKSKEETAKIIQDITESAARIGKMASDTKVNDATIANLLADEAKKIAEKHKLNAETKTINQLREALVNRAEYDATSALNDASMSTMDYIDREAEFESNRLARKWQRSPRAMKKRYFNIQEHDKYSSPVDRRASRLSRILQGKVE